MALLFSLARMGAVLLVASAVGWMLTGVLLPRDRRFLAERIGWS